MTDPAKRERAAPDLWERLPDGWRLGPTSYNPGNRLRSTTARGVSRGRSRPPETLVGQGEDELAAMGDLRIRLDERGHGERLEAIDQRGRAAFLVGAEERSQSVEGDR